MIYSNTNSLNEFSFLKSKSDKDWEEVDKTIKVWISILRSIFDDIDKLIPYILCDEKKFNANLAQEKMKDFFNKQRVDISEVTEDGIDLFGLYKDIDKMTSIYNKKIIENIDGIIKFSLHIPASYKNAKIFRDYKKNGKMYNNISSLQSYARKIYNKCEKLYYKFANAQNKEYQIFRERFMETVSYNMISVDDLAKSFDIAIKESVTIRLESYEPEYIEL